MCVLNEKQNKTLYLYHLQFEIVEKTKQSKIKSLSCIITLIHSKIRQRMKDNKIIILQSSSDNILCSYSNHFENK